jgi:hypothetical protein
VTVSGLRKSYSKTGEQHQPVDRIEVGARVGSFAHTKCRTHARLETLLAGFLRASRLLELCGSERAFRELQ